MDYTALDFLIEAEERGLLRTPQPPLNKGQCPYCLRQIGTGIHRHKQSCKERHK